MEFSRNIEELLPLLKTRKQSIARYIKNNFKEGIHYTINKSNVSISQHGGHNKNNYEITENVFQLVLNSFNLKNRYLPVIMNTSNVNIIMSLENQTIGFIENSFNGVIDTKRQYIFNSENGEKVKYIVDLYFPLHNLIIECDENNHNYRDLIYEKERENYLLSKGNSIIRFNPNDAYFDLSIVLKEINKILFSTNITNRESINCIFK